MKVGDLVLAKQDVRNGFENHVGVICETREKVEKEAGGYYRDHYIVWPGGFSGWWSEKNLLKL